MITCSFHMHTSIHISTPRSSHLNFADTGLIFIIGPHAARVALSYTLWTKYGRKGCIDDRGVIFILWDTLFCMVSPVVPILQSIRKYCGSGTWVETCPGLSIGCWHIVGSSASVYSVAVMLGAPPQDLSSSDAIQSNCYLSDYSICLAMVSYPELSAVIKITWGLQSCR
jgi:hypothetical protein